MDDTTSTLQAAMAENEWGQIKYARTMLERAMLHVFGLVEAGAETPWEDATAVLKKHLEPDVFEETAAAFAAVGFDVVSKGILDHSVTGEVAVKAITTGR